MEVASQHRAGVEAPRTPPPVDDLSSQRTPTRDSYAAAERSEKRPLADTGSPEMPRSDGLEDIAMTATDDNEHAIRDDGSDDSATDSARPPQKKKKSQRFFCTGHPPCNLSFTRSEHLARHIRFVFTVLAVL